MAIIRAIMGFLFAIALTGFAIANRQTIDFIYSPVHDPLSVPLYLITLLFMAGGFILGGLTVWINASKTRRIKREQTKTIKTLEKEIKILEARCDFSHPKSANENKSKNTLLTRLTNKSKTPSDSHTITKAQPIDLPEEI